jgi:hypothetical protein
MKPRLPFIGLVEKLRKKRDLYSTLAPSLGWYGALLYLAEESKFYRSDRRVSYKLSTKHAMHPLIGRSNSSDIQVFHQIFIEREYSQGNRTLAG